MDEIREQTRAKTSDTGTCLVAGLVLVETPVRVERCLAHVQPPSLMSPLIVEQNDVNRMPGSSVANRNGPKRVGRSYGLWHPVRLDHQTSTFHTRYRCNIKGNRNRKSEWIQHVPGMPYYDATRAEGVLCTEAEALAAGYRRAIVQ